MRLILVERLVGRAERHRLGDDLLDAAGRADRLIGKPGAGVFLVGLGPFGIDRVGEGGAGSRNLGGLGGGEGKHGGEGRSCRKDMNLIVALPVGWRKIAFAKRTRQGPSPTAGGALTPRNTGPMSVT